MVVSEIDWESFLKNANKIAVEEACMYNTCPFDVYTYLTLFAVLTHLVGQTLPAYYVNVPNPLVEQADLTAASTAPVSTSNNQCTPVFGASLAHPPNLAAIHSACAATFRIDRNNRHIAQRNRLAIRNVNEGVVAATNAILTPLHKFEDGNGTPLPPYGEGGAIGYGAIGVPAAVAVGAAPALIGAGGDFPVNLHQLQNLTHVAINRLAFIYNETFGIIAADDIAARRSKLEMWVQGF